MKLNLKNCLQYLNYTDPLKFFQVFGLVLAIQFSTCSEPRLVRYYSYDGSSIEAGKVCYQILEGLDYTIDIYDPEGGIIITTPLNFRADIRQFDYSVIVRIQDVIEVYLVVKKSIFKRSSDLSIGGKDLVDQQVSDSMPFRMQKKIFTELTNEFNQAGFNNFNRGKRIGIAKN